MTAAAQTLPAQAPAAPGPSTGPAASVPESWARLRADGDIQFAPVEIPPIAPREPGWLERLLNDLFAFFGDLLAPLGRMLGASWWWLQWVVLALAIGLALYLLLRALWPDPAGRTARRAGEEPAGWEPDRAASLALLEEADRLAAEGRFDEATRLLLHRSVGQIAAVRPDWVEPSSTARELAALPALPDAARSAFRVIAERVERSLFALRALERADWEAARTAYADFALARIAAPPGRERTA